MRRVVGIDVGSNAVTLAEVEEGTPPRLVAFAQVALEREAVREGEVVDAAAVTAAVSRLRATLRIGRASVHLGLASPRLAVRRLELPPLGPDEIDGALRYQAGEFLPIPLEQAAFDYAVLAGAGGEDARPDEDAAPPQAQVLVAAVARTVVDDLVAAVEAAGLPVAGVDLLPLALVRALSLPPAGEAAAAPEGPPRAAGIVSIGAGTTTVVVHEQGVPQFVRVLGRGSAAITDAIAAELSIEPDEAEALKRALGDRDDDIAVRARAAAEAPLRALVDDVRSSLDFSRDQPGALALGEVLLTGGGALHPGLVERLAAEVGVPVALARPRDAIVVGDLGWDAAEIDGGLIDPYLPAALGLALPDRGVRLDLLGGSGRGARPARSRRVLGGVAAALALVVVLGVPTLLRQRAVDREERAAASAEAETAALQRSVDALAEQQQQAEQLARVEAQINAALAGDVAWSSRLYDIAQTMPADTWLTALSGQSTGPAAATPDPGDTSGTVAPRIVRPGGPCGGTMTFTAVGLDFVAVADWLTQMATNAAFTNWWVPQATSGAVGERAVVDFTSTASLTAEACSDRAAELRGGT